MSTSPQLVQVSEFSHLCMQALFTIKKSIPDHWEEALQPYERAIRQRVEEKNINETMAVEELLLELTEQQHDEGVLRIRYMHYLAAYCRLAK